MKLSTKIRTWLGTVVESATRVDVCTQNEQARLATWALAPDAKVETLAQRDLRLDALARTIAGFVRSDAKTQTGLRARYLLVSYRTSVHATVRFADYSHRLSVDAPASGAVSVKGDAVASLTTQMTAVIAAEQARSGEMHRLLLATHAQWQETNQQIVNRTLMSVEKALTQAAARIDGYEARHLEQLALTDRLLSMQEERQAAREQAALDKEKHNFTKEKLDLLVPVLLNRLMGGGPGKGTPFFGEEIVQRLLGGLKPEQVDSLMQSGKLALTPEQLMLVGELYVSYGERENARKRGLNGAPSNGATATEPSAEATNGVTPPEDKPS
jgi:hypothetical protein